jgi:HAD superfamily hydrolase (TIGR01490 family)
METSDRPKIKVALFDICQTLVGVTTITDFMNGYLLAPKRNKHWNVWKFLIAGWYKILRRLDLLQPNAYRRHLISLYAGYTEEALLDLTIQYTNRLHTMYKQPVLEKLSTLKREGYQIFLVSAGLDVYLKAFAESLDATLVATVLEKNAKGVFTGKIVGVDCVGEGKIKRLDQIVTREAINWLDSYAFGDSQSDIPLLQSVGKAFVVDPSIALEKRAIQEGWGVIRS